VCGDGVWLALFVCVRDAIVMCLRGGVLAVLDWVSGGVCVVAQPSLAGSGGWCV